MGINFKNPKFILLIAILLVLLVVISICEGIVKNEYIPKEKEDEISYKDPVVQSRVVFNFVTIAHWDRAFEAINNDDKAYQIKDYVEDKISHLSTHKDWEIKDVMHNINDDLVISIYSKLTSDYVSFTYRSTENKIVEFLFNGQAVNTDDFVIK